MKKKLLSLLLVSTVSFTSVSVLAHTTELSKKDNEALSWLIQLDKNEIAVSQETLKKVNTPDVKKFAHLMIKEHTANLNQTESMNPKLSKDPVDTKDLTSLKEEGQELMKKLKPLKGKQYDVTYMKAMVDGHSAALETLDQDFLNNIDNEKVKKHLEETRAHITHHLEEAKTIDAKLTA